MINKIIAIFILALGLSCISFDVYESARTVKKNKFILRASNKIRLKDWTYPSAEVAYGITNNLDIKLKTDGDLFFNLGIKKMIIGNSISEASVSIQPVYTYISHRRVQGTIFIYIPDHISTQRMSLPIYASFFGKHVSHTFAPRYTYEINLAKDDIYTENQYFGIGYGWKYYWDHISMGLSISTYWKKGTFNLANKDSAPIDIGITLQTSL